MISFGIISPIDVFRRNYNEDLLKKEKATEVAFLVVRDVNHLLDHAPAWSWYVQWNPDPLGIGTDYDHPFVLHHHQR